MSKVEQQKLAMITESLDNLLKGTVPVISTDDLLESLSADCDWVVLDSREPSEFNVSHLPSAQWVGYADFSAPRVAHIPKTSNIVVYCSIGVRSERTAEKLMSLGFKRVFNLYGGIFSWANQGKALVDLNQQNTTLVHGYDKSWSKLVVKPFCDW